MKDHTPVIAGRVPEALHRQIKQAAKKSGRTMSDELAYRAAMSFQWEATLGEHEQARKRLMDMYERDRKTFEEATQADTERALERLGWATVLAPGLGGNVWLPPGRHADFPKSGWVDPNKPSAPLRPGRIIADPEFVETVKAMANEIAQPIIAAVKAGLDKEGGK